MRYSIIVPVYNAGAFLRECLDSVLAQTSGDWECICVDDGSEDSSKAVLREYADKDSRFRVIEQPHQGVGIARNAGMDKAKGDYLVFLDADDMLLPDALEGLKDAAADIVSFLPLKRSGLFDSLAGNMIAWNAIYRREAVVGNRFPNLVNCEDLVFATNAYARAKNIVAGVRPWYVHRSVEGSAYNSHSWRRVKDSWRSIWLMRRAYSPALSGFTMRCMLEKKLLIHFLLHVLAEVPRAVFNQRRSMVNV